MNEKTRYNAIKDKLDKLLDDNNLVGTFHKDTYPICLSVGQNMEPSAQMELFKTATHAISATDARLQYIFSDGEIIVRTDSRLIISDDLMTKIKGLAKNMHYLYLQAFFRERMEKGNNGSDTDN